ncbi:AHH domain-containing protein [Aestuariibius sp. 2305UL40-4]|uniref:AHH domain-containing protein n=1 Tax=Aestuariibius violaceus TaxID=3234132 RepID=UPI00345E855A
MPQDAGAGSDLSAEAISATVAQTADSRYNHEIDRDCATCSPGSLLVRSHYNDAWQTPMAGAPFRLTQDGETLLSSTLINLSDLGRTPRDVLTREERAQLGTFLFENAPDGMITFELIAEGAEGAVLQKEEEIRQLIRDQAAHHRAHFSDQWAEWEAESASGRAGLLLERSYAGFAAGLEEWFEGEQSFWASLGEIISDAWDAFKDLLGEMATSLHPDNIGETARILWEGAQRRAVALRDFVGELPGRAAELYAGTLRMIENMGAITVFLADFVSGDWEGVEQFCETTLPNLIEDEATREEWSTMIRNNVESWQLVLEIVGYTEGPALLMGSITTMIGSIPPQVWAGWGVASLAVVAIEVAVSAFIGFCVTAVEVLSGGAATAVVATIVVGRAAKWGRMSAHVVEQFGRLMGWIDRVIDKIVEMGQLAVRSRRRGTTQQGSVTRAAGPRSEATQDRDREDDGGRCGNCRSQLGERGHPATTPNFRNGNTTKGGGYRAAIMGAAALNPTSIGSTAHVGKTQAHHLVSGEGMARTSKARNYERLGYDINVAANLSLIPGDGFLACHLACQLHRGNHAWGSYDYHDEVRQRLGDITRNLDRLCRESPPVSSIQRRVDRKSLLLSTEITSFALPLTQVSADFQIGAGVGCADTASVNHSGSCSHARDHTAMFGSLSLPRPYPIRPFH